MRHAKSSWDDASLADYDRPLNDRGLEAAPLIGRLIKAAKLAVNAADITASIRFDERIYEASPQTLIKVLSEVDDEVRSAMVVGHNPGMEGLIRSLTGEVTAMPTAAFAVIDLDIKKWSDIGYQTGKLVEVLRPKEVGNLI